VHVAGVSQRRGFWRQLCLLESHWACLQRTPTMSRRQLWNPCTWVLCTSGHSLGDKLEVKLLSYSEAAVLPVGHCRCKLENQVRCSQVHVGFQLLRTIIVDAVFAGCRSLNDSHATHYTPSKAYSQTITSKWDPGSFLRSVNRSGTYQRHVEKSRACARAETLNVRSQMARRQMRWQGRKQ
jgi:hypothetical protein